MAEPLKRVFTGQGPLISDEVTKKGLGSLYDFSGDSFNKTQDAKKAFGTGILSELLKMGRQEVVPNKEIISTETPVSDIFGDFSLSGLNTMGSRDSMKKINLMKNTVILILQSLTQMNFLLLLIYLE